jgi:hypothetical protein
VLAPSSFAWLIRLSKAALMLESTGYRRNRIAPLLFLAHLSRAL